MIELDGPTLAWILLGSALGGMARYGVSEGVAWRLRESFPWGTLVVNVSGALALGLLLGWLAAEPGRAEAGRYGFAVLGFLGSYTTVSAFALQSLFLYREARLRAACGYVLLSALGCLLAVTAGFALGAGLG